MKTRITKLMVLFLLGGQIYGQTLDPSFHGGESYVSSPGKNFQWNTIESLANGTTLLSTYGDWRQGVELNRLKNDGEIDKSFGLNGSAVIHGLPTSFNTFQSVIAKDVLVLPNGKIFVAGQTILPNGKSKAFCVVLSENGTIHPATPLKEVGPEFFSLNITSVVALRNGFYALAGYAVNPATKSTDFVVLKVNQSGVLDPYFGTNGWKWVDFGADEVCTQVLTDASDKIFLAGYGRQGTKDAFLLASVYSDGSVDAGFGSQGRVVLPVSAGGHDRAFKAMWHPNNTLFVVGSSFVLPSGRDVISIVNLTANGSLNKKFDYDGKAFVYIGGKNDRGYDLAITNEGAIYVGGVSQQGNGSYWPAIVKFEEDGKLDIGFASKGILVIGAGVFSDLNLNANVAIDLQGDGKLVVSSTSDQGGKGQGRRVFRLNARENNSHAAFKVGRASACDGHVVCTPSNILGGHHWTFGDQFESSLATPAHTYEDAGQYKITHTYIDVHGSKHVSYQTINVDKSPDYNTTGYYTMPISTGGYTQVMAKVKPTSYYKGYCYDWEPKEAIQTMAFDGGSADFKFSEPGMYPVSVSVVNAGAENNHCAVAFHDTLLVAPNFNGCDGAYIQSGGNLVANGGFDDDACLPTTFKSSFPFKCELNGVYEPEKAAIVHDARQYSPLFDTAVGYSFSDLSGLRGNFLLLAERTSIKNYYFGRYERLIHRSAWEQKVYVEAGKTYRFKAGVGNISSGILGDYTFPILFLAVDATPIATENLYSDVTTLCGMYTANKTGWVTLKVIRQNGYLFSDGHVGIDDIEFYEVKRWDAQWRTEEKENENIKLSPNPASDKTEIFHALLGGVPVNSSVQLVDLLTGRIVKSVSAAGESTILQIGDLENGLYVARLFDANGNLLGSSKMAVSR